MFINLQFPKSFRNKEIKHTESEEPDKDSKEGPDEEIGEVFVTESRTVTTLEEAVVVTCHCKEVKMVASRA